MSSGKSRFSRAGAGASIVGMLLGSLTLLGCVPKYKPPTQEQPHAILKLRRAYELVAGTSLHEDVRVDAHRALSVTVPAAVAYTPRTDAILLHPVPATIQFGSVFFHLESRMVTETYYVQESYMDQESYSCGSGTSFRTCTRSVLRYRSMPKTHLVTRLVEVIDGSCQRKFRIAPKVGHVYLLQYTYQVSGACALSCFEQQFGSEGSVNQQRCPEAVLED